uniref:SFRICE_038122 n=1 Tax=Spodoptera frugiperda TaxID=7108 RepID=A0A2H1X3L5_SPOFR
MTVDVTPTSVSGINIKSSQNRLLIKNGRVVNDDGIEDLDVYIEDGIINKWVLSFVTIKDSCQAIAQGLAVAKLWASST